MECNWVIMGVGNLLMSDDGVGIHAVRELSRQPIPGVEIVDAGTDYLSALPYIEKARRVLILDAVRGGGRPGTIHRLSEQDVLPRPFGGSAHATSIMEARRLLSPGAAWPDITVLGVEPAVLDYGMELSPPVADALPGLVALARQTLLERRELQAIEEREQVAS